MKHNLSLWAGLTILAFIVLTAIIGPYLPFVDREIAEETVKMGEGTILTAPFEPSSEHWFGTDGDGRDIFSMLVVGAKDTLLIIFAITVLRYLIAIPLAFLASEKRGVFHGVLTGWNRVFSALPTIFSAVLLMHLPFVFLSDYRWVWVILILAIIEVGRVGYIFQEQAHDLNHTLYVQAGKTIGNSRWGIYYRYYVPNLFPVMVTQFFLDLARTALLIGQLGIFSIFITHAWVQLSHGYGEFLNTSYNWPSLLGTVRTDFRQNFYIPFFPALAITVLIISFQLLAEGFRKQFHQHG